MSEVDGVFVATEAATADVFGVGVDNFVIFHLAVPVGCKTLELSDAGSEHWLRIQRPKNSELAKLLRGEAVWCVCLFDE
jgi:hypothetical protein